MSATDDPRASASVQNVVRGDFFGGVAAGVVALPLALAFGVASGLGPVPGLYGAIAAGIVAALFGGHPCADHRPDWPDDAGHGRHRGGEHTSFRRGEPRRRCSDCCSRRPSADCSWTVQDRHLHPLRSVPRHIRIHERHWSDHHHSTDFPDAGRGVAIFSAWLFFANCICWAATSNGALLPCCYLPS